MEKLNEQAVDSLIYFCDNPQVVSGFTRKDLPRDTIDAIRKLQHLETSHNWKILFFYSLWAAAAWITLRGYGIAVSALGVIVMGLCVNGLPILMHDACHSLLSRNALINRWLGFISSAPGLTSYSAYRSIHTWHHAELRSGNDPDDIESQSPKSLPLVLV